MQTSTLLLGVVALIASMINGAPVSSDITPFSTNSTTLPDTTTLTDFKIKVRSSSVCENCMSCKAKQSGFLSVIVRYKLHIGAPFRDGWGCQSIENALVNDEDVPEIESFSCTNDGHDMTKIEFAIRHLNQGKEISAVFNLNYPSITAMGHSFNCPDF
ncbi:uncharacterized protein CLAFUR5_10240 [Fulvia fulva]|uniref:Uncharacterized protein n=1 Tax=Passalora fulva TaxID=5499 RepID=A0A9Q8PC60_PASFU|nr:uncharacterized protein CLAFUR5_10240 [Fulvia fulva]UJO19844.1 hypothetical protein CLAFUR5_10240 [Fulvia fulva]